MKRIDSHLHLWELDGPVPHPWLGPQLGELHADFPAEQAGEVLRQHGIDAAVLVQSSDSEAETEYLIAAAESHGWVAGVVGWVDLADPCTAEAQLERWLPGGKLVGVRHLIHDEPDPDFVLGPSVRDSLGLLASAGVPLDIPDAYPRHLHQMPILMESVPGLRLVIDHLSKPPLSRGIEAMAEWERGLRRIAGYPEVSSKVSSLDFGPGFNAEAIREAVEVALDCFGAERLMYGGDWPMTVAGHGYTQNLQAIASLVAELSRAEQESIWSGTARRVYGCNLGTAETLEMI